MLCTGPLAQGLTGILWWRRSGQYSHAAYWVLWWLLLLQCVNSLSSQLCPHLPAPHLLAFFKVRHASYSVRRDRGSRACLPWKVWSNPANYARLKTWTRKERLWMLMTLRSLIAQMMKLYTSSHRCSGTRDWVTGMVLGMAFDHGFVGLPCPQYTGNCSL